MRASPSGKSMYILFVNLLRAASSRSNGLFVAPIIKTDGPTF